MKLRSDAENNPPEWIKLVTSNLLMVRSSLLLSRIFSPFSSLFSASFLLYEVTFRRWEQPTRMDQACYLESLDGMSFSFSSLCFSFFSVAWPLEWIPSLCSPFFSSFYDEITFRRWKRSTRMDQACDNLLMVCSSLLSVLLFVLFLSPFCSSSFCSSILFLENRMKWNKKIRFLNVLGCWSN